MPLSLPHKPLTAALVAGLAFVASAGSAHAAESFVAVTGGDHLVTFHSDTAPGLTTPAAIDGLPAGQRVVALDARGDALVALSSSGALYGLDAARHRITGTLATLPITPDARAANTLTVAADGASARVIAGGRDLTVDLANGAVTRNDAAPTPLALDTGADGVLRGLDPAGGNVVSLDAAGVHVLASVTDLHPSGATAATTGSDGRSWLVTELGRRNAPVQSRLLRYDPATNQVRSANAFFQRDIDAIAATGAVADDTVAPKATLRVPHQTVREALRHHGIVATVKTSEAGQTVMSARHGKTYAFGLGTLDTPGTQRIVAYLSQAKIRAAAGKRLKVHVAVHDWAGNTRTFDTYVRLAP